MTESDLVEFYRDALERIAAHRPGTPGLHYSSIDQLLLSAIDTADMTLAIADKQATVTPIMERQASGGV